MDVPADGSAVLPIILHADAEEKGKAPKEDPGEEEGVGRCID